jgi:hypothetical protein
LLRHKRRLTDEDDGALHKGADDGSGKILARSFTSWRRRRREHAAPTASSRTGGAPKQLLDDGEAPEAWVDDGDARLGLGSAALLLGLATDLG